MKIRFYHHIYKNKTRPLLVTTPSLVVEAFSGPAAVYLSVRNRGNDANNNNNNDNNNNNNKQQTTNSC